MDKLALYFILFVAFYGKEVVCKRRDHKLKEDGGKIVGGNSTNIEAYPYQAYLMCNDGRNDYQCGGSIVSEHHVVTAAHCLVGMLKVTVRIGSTFSNRGGSVYETRLFSTHPMYNARTSDYDVAVVIVNKVMSLNGTTAKAIRMAASGSDVPNGTFVDVSGWGTTSENGVTTTTLMATSVPVVERAKCNELLDGGITSRMICAGFPEGGKDTCQGDSGGPAVATETLDGITSFGYGCAQPNSPGVYARVGDPDIRSYLRIMTKI